MNAKITLSLIMGLLLGLGLSAQTLSFSQVLLVDNNTVTVPAGKVWKIEAAVSSGLSSSSTSGTSTPTSQEVYLFYINGAQQNCTKIQASITGNHTSSTSNQNRIYYGVDNDMFPIWLPAGSSLAAGSGINYLSVIEFNIVP